MSQPYVGLLRSINVGGRTVGMARLRELLNGLGFENVRTHLQSGNVVFTATRPATELEATIEQALYEEFGFEVPCLVRTPEQLVETLDACPWPGDEYDPSKVLMLFLRERPAPDHFDELDAERFAPDEFRLIDRVVYCHFPNGMGRSKLQPALEGVRPALTMTGRNVRTVRKLIELAGEQKAG